MNTKILEVFIDTAYSQGSNKNLYIRAKKQLNALKRNHSLLLKASIRARTYLEHRGVRNHGTEGRTIVLPLLDEAIKPNEKKEGENHETI